MENRTYFTASFCQAGDAINFLLVQYYNQGPGVYATYEHVFEQSYSWWASTSVKEVAASGTPTGHLFGAGAHSKMVSEGRGTRWHGCACPPPTPHRWSDGHIPTAVSP